MIDVIDSLLAVADPEGEAAARLRRWRAQVERSVMLGPGPLAYINRLLRRLENVECRWLALNGGCMGVNQGYPCSFTADGRRFAQCPGYDGRPRPDRRRAQREVL